MLYFLMNRFIIIAMIKSGKPTIKQLAERAGVSKTAVSFAFNSPERISSETYHRIMDIAQEMGYSPDPVARILAKRKTQSLALLLPQSIPDIFQNPYITEILRGFGEVCDKKGFSVLVLSPLKGIISHAVLNAAVDGMAILGVTETSDVHSVCRQRNMPYVTIDAGIGENYINIGIDDEKSACSLASVLLKNGHRRICICSLMSVSHELLNEGTSQTMNARYRGIKKAVADVCPRENVDIYVISAATSFYESYMVAKKELSKQNRPTAIFCMAGIQTYGFYRAARELNLRIPDDLSIVTFDNLPYNELLSPVPTAVNQPGFEKGQQAAEILIDLLEGQSRSSVVIDVEVISTGSVAPVSGGVKGL